MRAIGKRFPGVIALDNVSLRLERGEVLALVGENGAGKSTLMKILGGVHQPDAGEIRFDGRPVQIRRVSDALRLGIAFIHQELNVLDNLDVAANVFLGREPSTRPFWFVNTKKIHADARPFLERLGLTVSTRTRLGQLSIAQRQLVEIARALSLDARVLIMDEPTSSLTLPETQRLLALVRELRSQGVSVIYISHRLAELDQCADRVAVLRDGKNAGELARHEINHDRLVSMMVGREIKSFYTAPKSQAKPRHLRVRRLCSRMYPKELVSFDAAQGEILGFAGLVGAGRSELMKALVGLEGPVTGQVFLGADELSIRTPRDAINHGLYLAPEDRADEGLVLRMSIRENITLPCLAKYAPRGLIQRARERQTAEEQLQSLQIKAPTVESLVRNLSGGNQQKVVLGKWLAMRPAVMILDEPTRGIDVGAKAEIYRLMRELAGRGAVILMISSDMEEVLHLSDRVAVMHEGRLTGVLDRADCAEDKIMQLAMGRPSACAQPSYNRSMKKDLGIFTLLVVLCALTALKSPAFLSATNLTNLANVIGLFGIFSIGIGLVIITGGIDLSVGSMIALTGVLLAMGLREWHWPWPLAALIVIVLPMVLGAIHGFLVTRLSIQPFIVTLCGLLIYRGLARFIADDSTKGFGDWDGFAALGRLAHDRPWGIPMPFLLLVGIAIVSWFLLHRSVYGRYLYAVGRNEEAARFCGINTRLVIAASYVIAGMLTGFSGILFAFYTNSVSPSNHGNFYELYGIAAAVLGGCSLRGGEGSILGIVIGTALLQVLQNLVNLLGIPSSLNFAVMGAVVLIGVLGDQFAQRRAARKWTKP